MAYQSKSIYSGLSANKDVDKDLYMGVYRGQQVMFERDFRNHHFTSEECAALCNNEMLELHDLERNGVHYAVEGILQILPYGEKNGVKLARFKSEGTISYDPEYVFATRFRRYSDGTPVVNQPNKNYEFEVGLDPFKLDAEQTHNEAVLSAMVESPVMPPLVQVITTDGLPKFVPLITLLTEDEIQALAERAGAKPWDGDPYYTADSV